MVNLRGMWSNGLDRREAITLIVVFWASLFVSVSHAADTFTWFLEVIPAVIGFIVFVWTYNNYKFPRIVYWILLVHALILMIGGHYTYAKVPLLDWISQLMGWHRNNYDKLGHFFQGFTPALIAQDLLKQKLKIESKVGIFTITVLSCLGISAAYELLEWGIALLTGSQADAFLGTQGYVWDTQSDMLCALVGSLISFMVPI